MVLTLAVPPGFEPFDTHNGFIDLIGPLYCRVTDEGEVFGMRVEPRHCNSLLIAHGGLLTTFADVVVSRAAAIAKSPPSYAVTVSLNTDFIAGAAQGAWIEGRASVGRIGGSLAFASCDVCADGVLLLRASGVMKYLPRARSEHGPGR